MIAGKIMSTQSRLTRFVSIACLLVICSCVSVSYKGPLLGRWKYVSGGKVGSGASHQVASVTVGDTQWYILDEIQFTKNGSVTQYADTCDFSVEPIDILVVTCGFGNTRKFNFHISGNQLEFLGLVYKKI